MMASYVVAAWVAQARGSWTFAAAQARVERAVRGERTRARIQLAAHELEGDAGNDEREGPVTARSGGMTLLQTLYWALPREIAGGAGLVVEARFIQTSRQYFLGDRPRWPVRLSLRGSTRRATSLTFLLGETRVWIDLPAGLTAAEVAGRIAAEISARSDDIARGTLAPGAVRFVDEDNYCLGLDARAFGEEVWISPRVDA